jgi:hypothetical protein
MRTARAAEAATTKATSTKTATAEATACDTYEQHKSVGATKFNHTASEQSHRRPSRHRSCLQYRISKQPRELRFHRAEAGQNQDTE